MQNTTHLGPVLFDRCGALVTSKRKFHRSKIQALQVMLLSINDGTYKGMCVLDHSY